MYLSVFVCAVTFPIVYLSIDPTPQNLTIVMTTGFIVACFGLMGFLYLPKLFLVLTGADVNENFEIVRDQSASSAGSGSRNAWSLIRSTAKAKFQSSASKFRSSHGGASSGAPPISGRGNPTSQKKCSQHGRLRAGLSKGAGSEYRAKSLYSSAVDDGLHSIQEESSMGSNKRDDTFPVSGRNDDRSQSPSRKEEKPLIGSTAPISARRDDPGQLSARKDDKPLLRPSGSIISFRDISTHHSSHGAPKTPSFISNASNQQSSLAEGSTLPLSGKYGHGHGLLHRASSNLTPVQENKRDMNIDSINSTKENN